MTQARPSLVVAQPPSYAVRRTLGLVGLVALAGLAGLAGCGGGARPAEAASSSSTMVAWEKCLVPISGDSSLRDLPPFPYRDPGPNGISVTGAAAHRSGPITHDGQMTLADALDAARVSAGTPVVVWRCENGKLQALHPRPDAPLRSHDWVVAPDPAAVY